MKCLSPANFNMTATREGQPLWTESRWARRMLGTALARGWIRAGGDTPRPPLGFICSHGQAPSPAAHHCSASPTVLPLCRAASSRASATSARTSRSHGCMAGTKLPFLFHLHISAVEEGSDLGTHCRAAEPSSHNTNLNPSLAWRQSCVQPSLSWRYLRESFFNYRLEKMLWRKAGIPGAFLARPFPSSQVFRCHRTTTSPCLLCSTNNAGLS